jgi:hypothetical protein
MSAASSYANEYIPRALENQDLERMKFAQNLRKNPDDYNKYVQSRIDNISGEIFNRKRTAFQKAHIDLARYMDMDHNANFYKSRSSDVDRLTNDIAVNNERIMQELQRDKDVSKRQFEINEWYNYNKLETLFFLQLFFISTLCMVVIFYYQKTGAITNQIAALLTSVLGAIVVITGIYRWRYTKRDRDPRLWHRRDFGTIGPVQDNKCGTDQDYTFDLNKILPEAATQCADQIVMDVVNRTGVINDKFNSWQDGLTSEIADYQKGSARPKSLGLGKAICDALATDE